MPTTTTTEWQDGTAYTYTPPSAAECANAIEELERIGARTDSAVAPALRDLALGRSTYFESSEDFLASLD